MNKVLYCLLILSIFSCGRPYNSSYSDEVRYGSQVAGSANFLEARAIIVSRCASCHAPWAAWTESGFISAGKIVARSLTDSILFTRIRGNGIGVGEQNMPPSENLGPEEIAKIRTWISTIP